ncbi:hypothetical protein [Alicyclobacillus fodiniaquatilis]|uniref:SHOCT domain-containing protein n=1 Tax=Alicyclobacillus fodiniaquatilis TaxID=1661150 RepID=A0ABW4JDP0_9BACL
MWCGHGFWFFPFGLFFFVPFLVFIVIRFCIFRNFNRSCAGPIWRDGAEAEAILKRRLASGDIGEAEYNKLKDLLKH